MSGRFHPVEQPAPLTVEDYPRDPAWLLGMRNRVNRRIKALIEQP